MAKRLYLEIKKCAEGYEACVHSGDPRNAKRIQPNPKIGPADLLPDTDRTLGQLVQALVRFGEADRAFFDDRGQLAFGSHLFQQTLGSLDLAAEPHSLVIVSEDEHARSLPWPLMVQRNVFLVVTGWAISQTSFFSRPFPDSSLPPAPKLLCVMPEPAGMDPTEADAHYHELVHMLKQGGDLLVDHGHLRRARTVAEMEQELKEFRPELVYYYGHGRGNRRDCYLCFVDDAHQLAAHPLVDAAELLRRNPPILTYINCCRGDSAGILGAGSLLSFCPSVISNRTIATVTAARQQGVALLKRVILDGVSPETAVAKSYNRISDLELTRGKPFWFTPVHHLTYSKWSSQGNRAHIRKDRRQYDPHWHLKVDRVEQYGQLKLVVEDMLEEQAYKAVACIWAGKPGQGLELFHERVGLHLAERLNTVKVEVIHPTWESPDTGAISYASMTCKAFDVQTLDEIPAKVRHWARNQKILVILNHSTVTNRHTLSLASLAGYLEWLDRELMCLLLDPNHFVLIGISFKVAEPLSLLNHVAGIRTEQLLVTTLKPLDRLTMGDLRKFVRTNRIHIPRELEDSVLKGILDRTGGSYEETLHELDKMIYDGDYVVESKSPIDEKRIWGESSG